MTTTAALDEAYAAAEVFSKPLPTIEAQHLVDVVHHRVDVAVDNRVPVRLDENAHVGIAPVACTPPSRLVFVIRETHQPLPRKFATPQATRLIPGGSLVPHPGRDHPRRRYQRC
jgi:hypothetical protein